MIRLREDIRLGLRLEGVAVDAMVDGQWKEFAKAESIGSCRLWRVPKTTAQPGAHPRDQVAGLPGACPTSVCSWSLNSQPGFLPSAAIPAQAAKAKWKVVSASYEEPGGDARNAIDGHPVTHLAHPRRRRRTATSRRKSRWTWDKQKPLKGFTYLPRQDGTVHGMVDQYAFLISTDGKPWTLAADGEFGNLRANPVEQTVSFPATKARYFKFIAKHSLRKETTPPLPKSA